MKRSRRSGRNLATDAIAGALAGAGAIWLMDRATTFLYDREPAPVRKREDEARGDRTAYEIVAEKAAGFAGHELPANERKRWSSAIHWTIGISSGAVYGVLRNRIPALGVGSGLAYAVAVWLAFDEAALTLLGVTAPPSAFPWQTHARGLAGHMVFGGAVESVFDGLDRLVPSRTR